MSKKINCSKCGTPNELNAMFCRNCGAKMDFSGLQSQTFAKERKKSQSRGVGKVVFGLVNLVVFLALLAVLGLMCWPQSPLAEVGDPAMGEEAKAKLVRLHEACENNIRTEEMVNEPELNAYLAMVLEGNAQEGGTPPVNVDDLNIMVKRSEVEVFTKMKMGPVAITYLVDGVPSVSEDGFRFDVTKVTAGHLPMPGGLGTFVANKVGRVFSGMTPEKYVLDHLAELVLAERRVRVTTRGS